MFIHPDLFEKCQSYCLFWEIIPNISMAMQMSFSIMSGEGAGTRNPITNND